MTILSHVGKILPPLNQKGPHLGWKIRKVVWLLILIAQKKGLGALNATQKTSALCKVPFMKKSRKTVQNGQKLSTWSKMTVFCPFFLIFSEMVLCRELGFFAFYSVHQTHNFELSKSTIQQLFQIFHLKGGPFWFRG